MSPKSKDIRLLIRDKENELTDKKRLVGKYIVDNYVEAAFCTTAELAQKVRVSEATVIRFANDLGFEGYPQLQDQIQNLVQSQLTTVDRLKEYHRHLEDSENPPVKAIISDLSNLEKTLHNLDFDKLEKAVELIIEADKVIVVGLRMSSSLARYMGIVLRKSLENVSVIYSSSDQFYEELVGTNKNILVIAIDFPRYSKATVQYLKAARREGVITIAVTDSELSPLCKNADISLLASVRPVSYVDLLAVPISLLGAIGTAVSLKMEPESVERLEKLEKIWESHQVFYKP